MKQLMTAFTHEILGKNVVVEFHFINHRSSCLGQILQFDEAHMF